MRIKSVILFFEMCLFLAPMLINSCQAIDGKEYSLQIKITTSCPIPFQSVSGIVVKVELTNMGNETFNGTLTVECQTKEGYWEPLGYPISNLTKGAIYGFSRSVSTDYAGRYWFTVTIEEEHLSTIKLYEDSRLIDEGWHVEAKDSIFLRSFTEFIMIVTGIVVPIGLAIVAYVYSRKKKK